MCIVHTRQIRCVNDVWIFTSSKFNCNTVLITTMFYSYKEI